MVHNLWTITVITNRIHHLKVTWRMDENYRQMRIIFDHFLSSNNILMLILSKPARQKISFQYCVSKYLDDSSEWSFIVMLLGNLLHLVAKSYKKYSTLIITVLIELMLHHFTLNKMLLLNSWSLKFRTRKKHKLWSKTIYFLIKEKFLIWPFTTLYSSPATYKPMPYSKVGQS